LAEIDLAAKQRHGAVAVHCEEGIQFVGIEHPRRLRRALGAGLQTGEREAHRERASFEHCAARECARGKWCCKWC
jgi:hypothetical protein